MSATMPPTDSDVLTGLRSGDERSLERIFRDRYPSLIQSAEAQLGEEAAFAPRVVEGTFLRVWAERERFTTSEVLDAFLASAVHDGAVRERSRRAALHRFEAHEHVRVQHTAHAPTSVDDAWAHVAAALHAQAPDTAATAHARADRSRHHAAEHVAEMGKPRPWLIPVVGGLAILAIVLGGIWWVDRKGEDAAIDRALAGSDVRVLSTKRAERASVTLNDKSTAALGADTRVYVPARFGTKLRGLRLEGTATFDVAKGSTSTFQVRTGNAAVVATGTVFTVSAFPDDSLVTVRTREGEVVVRAGDASRTLAAGQSVAVAKNGTMREPSAAAVDAAFGWTEGRFKIADQPLREVLPLMARWYAVDLGVGDSSLLARRVTMNVGLDSSRTAIAALEKSAGLKFGYEGQNMVLRDTAAAAPSTPAKPAKPATRR